MAPYKKQHWLPKVYLRNFKVPGTKQQVYVYKRKKPPKPRNIDKVAYEHWFYAVQGTNGQRDNIFEKQLSEEIEDKVKRVIADLESGAGLGDIDVDMLSFFVNSTYRRTPRTKTYHKNLAKLHIESQLQQIIDDKELFTEFLHSLGLINKTHDDVEKIRQQCLKGEGDAVFEEYLQLTFASGILPIAKEMSKAYLLSENWSLADVSTPTDFLITSDNPFIQLSPSEGETVSIWTNEQPRVLRYFPVTPKRGVFVYIFSGPKRDLISRQLTDGDVELLNSKVIAEANYYLYANGRYQNVQQEFGASERNTEHELLWFFDNSRFFKSSE